MHRLSKSRNSGYRSQKGGHLTHATQREVGCNMTTMSDPDDGEISELQQRLDVVEAEFEREMRSRGFDPAQHENVALTSSLAKLYQQREELKARLADLLNEDEQEA